MKAIGYIRVSAIDRQDNSADEQERLIRAQCEVKGMELAEVIVDTDEFSGKATRPGVTKVIDMVKAYCVDAVIIAKLDRLTRSTRDAIDLMDLFNRKGVALISIAESLDTKSPMGEFFMTMIAAIAQLERKLIGSRTSAGLQNLKAKGMPAGPAPYGWRSLGKKIAMVEDAEEQGIIERINLGRAAGYSLQSIASDLNSIGLKTRSGSEWKYQYVDKILKSQNERGNEIKCGLTRK